MNAASTKNDVSSGRPASKAKPRKPARVVTVEEAAKMIRSDTDYVLVMMRTGALPSHIENGQSTIPYAAVAKIKRRLDVLDELAAESQKLGLYD